VAGLIISGVYASVSLAVVLVQAVTLKGVNVYVCVSVRHNENF
jgi:hypothetical protein